MSPRPGQTKPLDYLRLLVGATSAALGSLVVVEARSWLMVVLTLGVSEWGQVLAALAATPLLPGWRRTRAGRAGAALGLLGAALALTPLLRAAGLARRLPAAFAEIFGDPKPLTGPIAPARPAALVARDVCLGVRSPSVSRRRITYATREGHSLDLDLYSPSTPAAPAPCIVVVHGGSWASGDSAQL